MTASLVAVGTASRAALATATLAAVGTATLGVLAPPALAGGGGAQVGRLGSAPATQRLTLVLPLRANVSGLERFANEVTTFGSPRYGEYQPVQTLARRFGASVADRARALRFLRRAGATHVGIDPTGLFANATMTVSLAQRLFATRLGRYEGPRATRFVAPSSGARVPASLGGTVTGVVGLDTRPIFSTPEATVPWNADASSDNHISGYGQRSGTAAGCPPALADRGFTPNQYLAAYDYTSLQAAGITGQAERVALIEIDGFNISDVRTFASCFGLPVPAINAYGVGIRHALPPGGEASLDLELLDAAAPGLAGIDVYESQPHASDVLRSLTAPLRNPGHVPDVISASLGTCEPALKLTVGAAGRRAAEGALAMAAASGISVLASSGDAGSSSCVRRSGPLHLVAASFPASSPYVTGVGGTNVVLSPTNQIIGQTVWNDAPFNLSAGGGALSGLFKRPSYQKGFEHENHRGVPDVSLLADVLPGFNIYCTAADCLSGSASPWIAVGGTSAASPLLAGGLALVDEVLRQHGKQNVGQPNSLLYRIARRYASAGAISDVTTNDNDLGRYLPGSLGRPLGCCTAGPGYDLASGLGSVDLGRFAALAESLQPPVAGVSLSFPPQRPVRRRRLLVKVSCLGRCIAMVTGTVAMSGSSFGIGSEEKVFAHAGHKTLELRFTPSELSVLRAAVHHHRPVVARVVAEVLDAGGNVEARSLTRQLSITR
jgi:kumamolisin